MNMNILYNRKLTFLVEPILIILPISLLFSNLISEILILILVSIFFVNIKKDELIQTLKNKVIFSVLILYFFLVINYLLNINKDPDFYRSIFFIRFVFYIISINYFLNKDYVETKKIFSYWGIIIFLVCLDLQIQNILGKNIFGYESIKQGNLSRLGGLLDDELKIGYLINSFFIVSLGSYFFYHKKSDKSFLLLVTLFILLVLFSVYLTSERANFLILLLLVFSFLIFSKYKLYFLSTIIILIPIILINISYLKSDEKMKRMFFGNVELAKKNLSLDFKSNNNFLNKDNQYFAHYSTALQIAKDFPLTGVGLKNFRNYCNNEIYLKQVYPTFKGRNCSTHPHNLFFEIISELGFLGFIVFYSIFGYFFYLSLVNSFKYKNIFLFGNTIFLMSHFIPLLPRGSFFSNWNAMLFWTIFGISLYLLNKNNKHA